MPVRPAHSTKPAALGTQAGVTVTFLELRTKTQSADGTLSKVLTGLTAKCSEVFLEKLSMAMGIIAVQSRCEAPVLSTT